MKTIVKTKKTELNPQLLTHLKTNFGDQGKRASELLETAQILLEDSSAATPRLSEAVAFSLREAMISLLAPPEALFAFSDARKSAKWKKLSRSVESAKQDYLNVRSVSQEDEQKALDNLVRKIGELERFHKKEEHNSQELLEIFYRRTSYLPTNDTPTIKKYSQALEQLNQYRNGSAKYDLSHIWSKSLTALESLFMPSAKRALKLESLAKIEAPTEDDINQLRQCAVTEIHYRYFFEHLSSISWLELLLETEIIYPKKTEPGSTREYWPAAFAFQNLYSEYPNEIITFLETLYEKNKNNHEAICHITLCAFHIGSDALPFVLKSVLDFPARRDILEIGYWASEKAHPASDLLTSFFDKLVSPNPPEFHEDSMSLYHNTKLIERFSEGISEANHVERTELICYKLKAVPESNRTRRKLEHLQGGSVSTYRTNEDDFFSILLNGLLTILQKSQSWTSVEALIKDLPELPPFLHQRVRAWLATTDNAQNKTRIREIAEAIKSHKVTGDHMSLLDRIAKDCEISELTPAWNEALGDAPSSEKIKKAISENFIPDEWRRKLDWVNILTEDSNQNKLLDNLNQDWELTLQELAKLHLPHNRNSLQFAMRTEPLTDSSPISAYELEKLSPKEAASLIAAWRTQDPPRSDLEVAQTPYELGGALRSAVQANPSEWLKSPQIILEALRHPTYIHPYLDGIAAAFKNGNNQPSDQQISELIGFIETIYNEPRDVEPLGKNQSGYDTNWNEVKRASIKLINTLTNSKIGYGNWHDRTWDILKTQIQDRSEPLTMSTDYEVNTYLNTFNRTCTYAMHSLLSFSAYEYSKFETVRPETLQILTDCLRLSGQDGIEFRAIISPTLHLLERLAPEWLENTRDLMFGEQAPDGLAQRTVDQTFSWGEPSDCLFKNYKEMIENSVKRHVPDSMFYYLVGMLREHEGYSLKEVLDFLDQVPPKAVRKLSDPAAPWQKEITAISHAGECLGRLMRVIYGPEAREMAKIADCFWGKVLEMKDPKHLGGFGWYSEAFSIDDTQWAKRTLETLRLTGGHINHEYGVTKRALRLEDKKSCLEIFDYLIRGNSSLYTISKTNEYACQALESAQELNKTPEYDRLKTALLERGLEILPEKRRKIRLSEQT